MPTLRIGTRSSKLAVWQAEFVRSKFAQVGVECTLVFITSKGDSIQNKPAHELGLGVFTKALDEALLNDEIDIAVHSLKDVPTSFHQDLQVKCVLKRGNPWDVLVTNQSNLNLNQGGQAVIATGSPRRKAFWQNKFPSHEIVGLRGNVDRRIDLLKENRWDGAVMALAGLERLNIECFWQKLDWMTPQPGQGAICIMTKTEETWFSKFLDQINHSETQQLITIERDFLTEMGGGCSAPIAAFAELQGEKVILRTNVLSFDGKENIEINVEEGIKHFKELGIVAASLSKEKGALELLKR